MYAIDRYHLLKMRQDQASTERAKIIKFLDEVTLFDSLLTNEKKSIADGALRRQTPTRTVMGSVNTCSTSPWHGRSITSPWHLLYFTVARQRS